MSPVAYIFCDCQSKESASRTCPLVGMGVRHEPGRKLEVAEQARWELLGGVTLAERVAAFERDLLLRVLSRCGQRHDAADALGISREGLYKKMHRHGISMQRAQSRRKTIP